MTSAEPSLVSENWKGSIPVVFDLASSDTASFDSPPPLYKVISRNSYFLAPEITHALRKHFQHHAPAATGSTLWLEWEGVPLRWSLPVGPLFDSATEAGERRVLLPWRLTVRFRGFPHLQVEPFRNDYEVLAMFKSAVKESSHLVYGSAQPAMALSEQDWAQFWGNGVLENSLEQIVKIRERFAKETGAKFRGVAVRMLCCRRSDREGIVLVRRPMPVVGREQFSLDQAIREMAPGFCAESPNVAVMICGIEMPMETPILWLWQNFAHPDGFLYIVLAAKSDSVEVVDVA